MPGRALIVIDMLTAYDFEDAERLASHAERVVPVIAGLIERARDEDARLLFVNDNYGHWNSSREELVEIAMNGRRPDLVEPLRPRHEDLFIVKARHSIFYGTPVEYLLLSELGVDRLVLTGQVTEQCVLYSALDAYVRRIGVAVVRDGVAPIDEGLGDAALTMMERNMRAEICDAGDCRLR
jgi:nicotinamidase-related amidase